jgi:hypothetical protein
MTKTVQELEARIAELEGANRIKNIKTEVDKDGILIIEVDLTKEFGKSNTGKSTIVASTGGFTPILDWGEGFVLNLNIVKK